jgi:zinc D-Ala-D-Ala carboxypeptidase
MDRQVSLNFSLRELIYSDTSVRLQIDNTPTNEVLVNLQNVCQFILEPVRNYFNKPITITSGYRSPELCKAIGSSATSQHTFGQAVDFEILGIPNKEVSDWIVNHLDYDQCILEFWTPSEPNSGWVHCSWKPSGNRKMYLRAFKSNQRIVYEVL